MADSEERPFGSFLSTDASDAWAGGVGVLDKWAISRYGYAEGYRRGARMLAEASCSEPAEEADRLVFPVLFLYRHALELKIKNCLVSGYTYLASDSEPPRLHDLLKLWGNLVDIGEQCGVAVSGSRADKALWVVTELQRLDTPGGTAWRYSHQTDGSQGPLEADGRKVDLLHVSDLVDEAIETLEGWDAAIYEKAQLRADAPWDR